MRHTRTGMRHTWESRVQGLRPRVKGGWLASALQADLGRRREGIAADGVGQCGRYLGIPCRKPRHSGVSGGSTPGQETEGADHHSQHKRAVRRWRQESYLHGSSCVLTDLVFGRYAARGVPRTTQNDGRFCFRKSSMVCDPEGLFESRAPAWRRRADSVSPAFFLPHAGSSFLVPVQRFFGAAARELNDGSQGLAFFDCAERDVTDDRLGRPAVRNEDFFLLADWPPGGHSFGIDHLLSAGRTAPLSSSTTTVTSKVHRAVFIDWISIDREGAERRDGA